MTDGRLAEGSEGIKEPWEQSELCSHVSCVGENLGGGAIHLPRAFEIPGGGATNGSGTQKERQPPIQATVF